MTVTAPENEQLEQRIEQLERDLDTLRRDRKWQWRCMVGLTIFAVFSIMFFAMWTAWSVENSFQSTIRGRSAVAYPRDTTAARPPLASPAVAQLLP